jgi:hypothetical protein
MDTWVLVIGVAFYVIFGMLVADTLLAKGERWFTITLFWFPLAITIILSLIILAIALKVMDLWEYVKRIRKPYF